MARGWRGRNRRRRRPYFLIDLLGQSYPDGRPWLEDRTGLPLLIVALNAAMAGGAAFHGVGRRRAGLKLLAISSAAICGLGFLLLSQAGGWIIPSGLIGLTSSVLGWCAGTPAPEVKAPARGKPEPAKRKLAA